MDAVVRQPRQVLPFEAAPLVILPCVRHALRVNVLAQLAQFVVVPRLGGAVRVLDARRRVEPGAGVGGVPPLPYQPVAIVVLPAPVLASCHTGNHGLPDACGGLPAEVVVSGLGGFGGAGRCEEGGDDERVDHGEQVVEGVGGGHGDQRGDLGGGDH